MMEKPLKKLDTQLIEFPASHQAKVNKRLNQLIPPLVSAPSLTEKAKPILRTILLYFGVLALGLAIFLGYCVAKDFDTVWHYLKTHQTIAFTLTKQKSMQDTGIDGILAELSQPGKTLQQKLVELAVSGYAQNDFNQQKVVVYDNELRLKYQLTFEERIQTAIDAAYHIYNNFDSEVEREVYGITTDELIYNRGLRYPGYPPLALKNSVYEGRHYFPFALIAGQVTGIDPLRLLKIFEIETGFDETAVGRNTDQIGNDDIGIAQNNLAVLPRLIRDILTPESPVYSPFFEFLSLGTDLETGKPLTWSTYLVRLEEELNGTYNHQKDPTGQYYINRLKAPHIGAFLAAYHIKRDETYHFEQCRDFYRTKAKSLKEALKLPKNLNPDHWTDYTFYNGGPKRWYIMREFLKLRKNNQPIPATLKDAVQITKRRNMTVQKIGEKNEHLRNLAYDMTKDEIVENDGLFNYGLYDFAKNYKYRDWLYNLNVKLAQGTNVESLMQTQ